MSENEKKKLNMSGPELISLACSLAIGFSKQYDCEDLRRLRLFFQSIATNITIIEIEGIKKKN